MKNMNLITRTRVLAGLLGIVVTASLCTSAYADQYVYANNAGSAGLYKIDLTTGGNVVQSYAEPTGGNGRGMVVVGNVIYSTVVDDNHIYETDATTGLSLGSIATDQASLSTLAWDGANFWTTDYSGTNQGFEINTSGTTIKTLTFSQSTNFMDGMEYFNGKLIVNNHDGGISGPNSYSIYDLNGNLLTANFITAPDGTGIAFDGTNFLVSDVYGDGINVYDGTTGAWISKTTVTGDPAGWLVEDISVDYSTRSDTGGVPDGGSTLLLVGGSLVSLFSLARRFRLQGNLVPLAASSIR
jgi:hypothetical protein